MLKWRSNKTCKGGGYAPSDVSRGARLWLSLILSFICAALLCCAFFVPFNSDKTAHAEVTIPACPCHAEGANVKTWTKDTFKKSNDYYINGGNYILEEDIEITQSIPFFGTVNVCLNGHMIYTKDSTGLGPSGILNLYDCGNDEDHKHYYNKDKNGKYNFIDDKTDTYLTGGVVTGGDYGIYIYSGATCNMYGGNLAGNGMGVAGGSVFNMYGGKICGNSSGFNGSGIYFGSTGICSLYGGEVTDNRVVTGPAVDIAGKATLNISGSVRIYDNILTDNNGSKAGNCYSLNGITVGELNDDAYIGITVATGQNFADGTFIKTNNSGIPTQDLLGTYFFDDAGAHIHKLSSLVEETYSTCTVRGMYAHYTCEFEGCGTYFDASRQVVTYESLLKDLADHSITTVKGKEPTCTETGLTDGEECSVCHTVITKQTTIPATGHTPITVAGKPATCTETGLSDGKKCSVCDEIIVTQTVIPALDHDWDDGVITKEATESERGIKTYTCKTCNETREEVIPKIGHIHSYTSEVIAPTCTEQGYTLHTCTDNDDSYKDNYTDPLGHSYKLECNIENGEVKAKLVCETCGDERAVAPDEITVTDGIDEDGNPTKTITVTVDGERYTETVIYDHDDPNKPVDPVDPDNPDDPNGDGKKDGFPWWIIAIAAAVLLLFIVLIIIIVKRRHNDDYDDDYDDEYYDDEDDDDEGEEEDEEDYEE